MLDGERNAVLCHLRYCKPVGQLDKPHDEPADSVSSFDNDKQGLKTFVSWLKEETGSSSG